MHVIRAASFSRCGLYRYSLTRRWDSGVGRCVFIGLNPSTADAKVDDPTIRRCMGFTRNWGYNELIMVNLFAYRTPHPELLKKALDPVGPNNRRAVTRSCQSATLVVAAWGAHGTFLDQADRLSTIWSQIPVHCFGTTLSGQPLHPLYQRTDAKLTQFNVNNP